MYIIIRSFLFISVVAVISGCVSLDITHTPPSSFIDNCNEPQLPLFMIKVDEDPGLGSFASVRVFLLANGKEHQMNRQISDSIWGTYSLYASVDNDGEVRYRYRIESRRTGYTSVSKSYRPNDRWEVAPMGKITWSSPSEIVVPSSVEVFEATYGLFEYHGFNREIHIQKEAIPRNATETAERIITITNGYAYGIMFFNIKILSEMPPSGIEMDEFSITEQDGNPITLPVNIQPGESKVFKVSFTGTISLGSKNAVIIFEWNPEDFPRPCLFGPVHITGIIYES